MKVSTRVEYGVLALADIALYSDSGTSVPALEIARRQGISKKYLEQILPLLRQARLIRAQKGLRGGYLLARPAGEITLSDILNALDNSLLESMPAADGRGTAGLAEVVNACLWGKINQHLNTYASSVTLADFLTECKSRIPQDWDLYVI